MVPPAGDEGPRRPRPFGSFLQFFAFGFGSGLSPRAPGTAGTLAAIPLYLLVGALDLPLYSGLLLLTFLAGIYLCEMASRELGVHDHPGIVWDEIFPPLIEEPPAQLSEWVSDMDPGSSLRLTVKGEKMSGKEFTWSRFCYYSGDTERPAFIG